MIYEHFMAIFENADEMDKSLKIIKKRKKIIERWIILFPLKKSTLYLKLSSQNILILNYFIGKFFQILKGTAHQSYIVHSEYKKR